MTGFIDAEYETLICNLLHDTKYVDVSNMAKMAGLRKHAEVLARKILNLGSEKYLTLGQSVPSTRSQDVRKGLEVVGHELGSKLIEIALETTKIPICA